MKNILLNRDDFKNAVFQRDGYKCVVCKKQAIDAHHIIDRSIWEDGGYYLNNGVSLCEEHHIEAENTSLRTDELRVLANIIEPLYPPYLNLTEFVKDYDKWGNPVLKNLKRLKGYWFNHDNVQKMLKAGNVLHLFEKDFEMIVDKYPRTLHVFSSPGTTSDDRIAKTIKMVCKGENVMTEKLDGSNLSLTKFGIYGRSRVSPSCNPWDAWLKPFYETIKNDLGDLEYCGENMYGIHSIEYSGLSNHLYIFGIRDTKRDMWLSWEEVEFYSSLIDLPTVPVLFKTDSTFNVDEKYILDKIDELMLTPSVFSNDKYFVSPKEGVVTRIAGEFPNDMFFNSIFKWVRANHIKTSNIHWQKNWKRALLNHERK